MEVDEFFGTKRVNITRFAKELNYSREHLNRVIKGISKPGKKLGKALEAASNGKITYEDLLNNYKDRHKDK